MSQECCWKSSSAVLSLLVIILLVMCGKMYFFEDKPTEPSVPIPRFGIFQNKPTWDPRRQGRIAGSLENVAIILKSTSIDDTKRWFYDIRKQRKSLSDLPIYTFTENPISEYLKLKKLKNDHYNVFFIQGNNHSSLIKDVLKRPQIKFYIEIEDTQYMGADFADYYFMGREAMEWDDRIECVCGNSLEDENEYGQPGQIDIFWLNDEAECDIAPMLSRASFEQVPKLSNTYCIRPEVGRVARDKNQVTKLPTKVAKFDARMMTVGNFQKRLEFDLEKAVKLQKVEWENLPQLDEHAIYMFPSEEDDDLEHYFGGDDFSNFTNSRSFESIVLCTWKAVRSISSRNMFSTIGN